MTTSLTDAGFVFADGSIQAKAAPFVLAGQCQLTLSAGSLKLAPKNGNLLTVNGVNCTVPDAGVTLAPPAVASTTYLIYAVATAGVITSLEASTTAHATDTTAGNKGVEIKTGDSTRTLVGIAPTSASNAWVDTGTSRMVRGWFNRAPVATLNAFTVARSTTSATFVEINSEIRCAWVQWADDVPTASIQGGAYTSIANTSVLTAIGWDGTADANTSTCATNATSLITSCSTTGFKQGLSEGVHYATLTGAVNGGATANWQSAFAGVFNSLSVRL